MVAIKTTLSKLPDYCDDCQWYSIRPHPCKGWTEQCELMCQCMDDDADEGWIYDGNGRPNNCPLIEIKKDSGVDMKESEKKI